jgi:AraC family transcriptional regulator, transcriptional activator of pobA
MKAFPTYRLYGENTETSSDFWIHTETVPERTKLHNWHIERHRHDGFFQLFWLSDGDGEIAELATRRHFRAPCAILVPPGAIHGFSFSRDVDGLVMTAMADRLHSLGSADQGIATLASATRIVALHDDAQVGLAMRRLHAELHGRAQCRLLLLEPLMISAIVALARCGTVTGDERVIATTDDLSN